MSSKIKIFSKKITDVEQLDSLSRYLGKKVFSKSGEKVGKIKDVVFDKGNLKGYIVSGKKKLFIDKEFFTQEFEEAMMLQIDPVTNLIGKIVFDGDGKRVGKVKDVERSTNGNDFTSLLVRKNIISKSFAIDKKTVDVSKKSILLNVPLEK